MFTESIRRGMTTVVAATSGRASRSQAIATAGPTNLGGTNVLMTQHDTNESQRDIGFHRVSVPITQQRKVRSTWLPPLLIIVAIALAVYLATRFL